MSTVLDTTRTRAFAEQALGCWGEEKARELLAEAGFTSVEVSRVEGDPLNAYYVCRP